MQLQRADPLATKAPRAWAPASSGAPLALSSRPSRHHRASLAVCSAAAAQACSSARCAATPSPAPLAWHCSGARHLGAFNSKPRRGRSTACRVVQVEQDNSGRRRVSDAMMSTREDSASPEATGGKSPSGYLALLGVAILWGSYTPAIRLLYQIDT